MARAASEIAHLEARQDGRTPDYLLVDVDGVRGYVSALTGVPKDALPLHWPLESKAWSRGAVDGDAVRDAVRQLAAYWLDTRTRGNQAGAAALDQFATPLTEARREG